MDCQIYNDKKTVWFICYEEQEVLGFVSIKNNNNFLYIDNLYVIDKYRNKGVASELIKALLEDIHINKEIRLITRNLYSQKLFKKYGFEIYGQNGRYVKMRLLKE